MRAMVILAVLSAALLWAALLASVARRAPASVSPPPGVSIADLERLEARLIHARELTRRWEWLAERHRQVSQVACDQLAEAATTRRIP